MCSFHSSRRFKTFAGGFRRFQRVQRGEVALVAVLLVLGIIVIMMVLPMERFVGLLRVTGEVQRTHLIRQTTEDIQEQMVVFLQRGFLSRFSAHFQSCLEQVPAFRNELIEGRDPLPTLEYRQEFFRRAWMIPHHNLISTLEVPENTTDPRFNTVRDYLESIQGQAVIETRYISFLHHPSLSPCYVLECDIYSRVNNSNPSVMFRELTGNEHHVRLGKFLFYFIPTFPAETSSPAEREYFSTLVLHPEC